MTVVLTYLHTAYCHYLHTYRPGSPLSSLTYIQPAHTYIRQPLPQFTPPSSTSKGRIPLLPAYPWLKRPAGRDCRLTSSCICPLVSPHPRSVVLKQQSSLTRRYKCPPTPTISATLIDRDSIHHLSGTLVNPRTTLRRTIRQLLNTRYV